MLMRRQRPRRLAFEALERRALLSGEVAVAFNHGVLSIKGQHDNGVAIVEDLSGMIDVLGVNYAGGATNVHGDTSVSAAAISAIDADFGKGSNFVSIGLLNVPDMHPPNPFSPSGLAILGEVNVSLGGGNNVLIAAGVAAGGFEAASGAGDDFLLFSGVHASGGQVEARTGSGNDVLVASLDHAHIATAMAAYISAEAQTNGAALTDLLGLVPPSPNYPPAPIKDFLDSNLVLPGSFTRSVDAAGFEARLGAGNDWVIAETIDANTFSLALGAGTNRVDFNPLDSLIGQVDFAASGGNNTLNTPESQFPPQPVITGDGTTTFQVGVGDFRETETVSVQGFETFGLGIYAMT